MPSAQEIAKRALVQLVRTQGSQYGVDVAVTRESPPGDVTRAYRALARKAHPDKPGGSKEDFQKLSASYNAWADLMKAAGAVGRPPQPRAGEIQVAAKGAVIPRDPHRGGRALGVPCSSPGCPSHVPRCRCFEGGRAAVLGTLREVRQGQHA